MIKKDFCFKESKQKQLKVQQPLPLLKKDISNFSNIIFTTGAKPIIAGLDDSFNTLILYYDSLKFTVDTSRKYLKHNQYFQKVFDNFAKEIKIDYFLFICFVVKWRFHYSFII